jgi:hypothetical protein
MVTFPEFPSSILTITIFELTIVDNGTVNFPTEIVSSKVGLLRISIARIPSRESKGRNLRSWLKYTKSPNRGVVRYTLPSAPDLGLVLGGWQQHSMKTLR